MASSSEPLVESTRASTSTSAAEPAPDSTSVSFVVPTTTSVGTSMVTVNGGFLIADVFTSSLSDATSTEYATLQTAVVSGLENFCLDTTSVSSCDVTIDGFTSQQSGTFILVEYSMSIISGTDTSAVLADMVALVESDPFSLVLTYHVWASSLFLDNEQNTYCSSNLCGNFGTCTDVETTYSCTCIDTYVGSRCLTEVTSLPVQFVIDMTYDAALIDTSSSLYADLQQRLYDGLKIVFTSLFDFSELIFSEDVGTQRVRVNLTMRVRTPFSNAAVEEGFTDTVMEAEQGLGGLLNDLIVFSSSIVVGPFEQDYCDPNPCNEQGTCTETDFSYNCDCASGYFGDNCETAENFCETQNVQCLNGGSCVADTTGFNCNCVTGYEGSLCETDIDHCVSDPCDNGGTCIDEEGFYTCNCGINFGGTNCQNELLLMPFGLGAGDSVAVLEVEPIGTFATGNIPIPNIGVDTTTYDSFYISANGYVGFGEEFFRQSPASWSVAVGESRSENFAVLAPLWTSNDYNLTTTDIYYHIYQRQSESLPTYAANQEILDLAKQKLEQSGRAGFNPRLVVVVTWQNTIPLFSYDPALDDPNTFQLVLMADPINKLTSVMYLYESSGWRDSGLIRDALIGYYRRSDGIIAQFEHPFSSLSETGPEHSQAFNLDVLLLHEGSQVKGVYAYEIPVTSVTNNNDILCENWYETQRYLPPGTVWSTILQIFGFQVSGPAQYFQYGTTSNLINPCPCDISQLLSPAVFGNWLLWPDFDIAGERRCFVSRFGFFGTRTCCYNLDTFGLILGNKNVGHLSLYHPRFDPGLFQANDQEPYNFCCGQQATKCNLYTQLRPQERFCTFIRPWFSAGFGDPHFLSLDGYKYTFNGLGEYVLMGTNVTEPVIAENGFANPADTGVKKVTILVRHIQARDSSGTALRATVFGAYAIHVTGSVPIYIGMTPDRSQLDIRISGSTYNYSAWFANATLEDFLPQGAEISGVTVFKSATNRLSLTYDQALTFEVTIEQGQLGHQISIEQDRYGDKTFGLLGNFNGDPDDDLRPRDSIQALSPNTSDENIYTNFGETWKLENNVENLFTLFYSGVETYSTINVNHDYEPAYFDDLLATEQARAESDTAVASALQGAQDNCGNNEECLFDWLLTRNLDVSRISAVAVTDASRQSANLGNSRPNITAPDIIEAIFSTPSSISVTVTDLDDGATVILTIGGLDGFGVYTYNNVTEILTWTPDYVPSNGAAPNITLDARDGQGGVAATVTVKIRYCYCVNGGSCPDVNDLQTGYGLEDNFALVRCSCEIGWTGVDCSAQFDACVDNPCDYSDCTDLDPEEERAQGRAFTCGTCRSGYTKVDPLDALSNCQDEDECSANNGQGDCIPPAVCVNNIGSYTCTCPSGYRLSHTGLSCSNIDECSEQTSGCNQLCTDNIPLFTCACHAGYILQADERTCLENLADTALADACPDNHTCSQICGLSMNDGSSKQCYCRDGYELNPLDGESCDNIDECARGTDSCHTNSTCVDTPGGYNCSCDDGFILATDLRTCLPCEAGYWGAGCLNTCTCRNSSTVCDIAMGCMACPDGYQASGNCDQDIDECSTSPCTSNTDGCTNLPGSYQCVCAAGYEYETQNTCQDINECASNPCQNGASCVNDVNSYSCNCAPGYQGNRCETDINECASSPCQNSGMCNNLVNAFTCSCSSQWQGVLCHIQVIPMEEMEYSGSFIIERTFSSDLQDTTTSAYTTLATAVRNGVTSVCTDGRTAGICEVNEITFSDTDSNVYVTFMLNITDFITSNETEAEVFTLMVVRAEDDILLDGFDVKSSSISLGQYEQDYCTPDPCSNNGTCSETSDGYSCTCLSQWTGNTCVLRNLQGNFTLDAEYIPAYDDISSVTYMALRDQIVAGIVSTIDGVVPSANSHVYTMSLSPGSVVVVFKVSVDGTITDTQIVAMFNALVAGAEADTLIPGYIVIASSVALEGNEQNYCESMPCLHSGQCTEEAEGFTCTCSSGFTGATCDFFQIAGQFIINSTFDPLLQITSSSSYIALSSAVIAGIEAECQIIDSQCGISNVAFTSQVNTSLTTTSFELAVPDDITEIQRRAIFDELVENALDNSLISGSVVLASSLVLGIYHYDCHWVTCYNGGTCVDTNGLPTCVCPSDYIGEVCDILIVTATRRAEFTITNRECTNSLTDPTSAEYTQLKETIVAGVAAQCQTTMSIEDNEITCDVRDVRFACGSIDVSYVLVLLIADNLQSQADEFFEDVFDSIVAAAENGDLLDGDFVVDLESITVGELRSESQDSGLGETAIVGIAVGVSVFLIFLIAAVILFLYMKFRLPRKSRGRFQDESDSNSSFENGYFHKRQDYLFWQSGHVAKSIASHDSGHHKVYLDNADPRKTHRNDVRHPFTDSRYMVSGDYRSLDRQTRHHRDFHYDTANEQRASYYLSKRNTVPSTSYDYDFGNHQDYYRYNRSNSFNQGRMRTIANAVNVARPIDWSGLRKFSQRTQARPGKVWAAPSQAGSAPSRVSSAWGWN